MCLPLAVQAVRDPHPKETLAIPLYTHKPPLLVDLAPSALGFLSFLFRWDFSFSRSTSAVAPRRLALAISQRAGKCQATEQATLARGKLEMSWPGDLERGNVKFCPVFPSLGEYSYHADGGTQVRLT